MKKRSKKQQKAVLGAFCILFTLALLFSISHNRITVKPMYIPAHIGRNLSDSLTHPKK
jgi:hypothetical protein